VIYRQGDSQELIGYQPHQFNGQEPFVIAFNALHKICRGSDAYSNPRTEPIDHQALIIDLLKQAAAMPRQGNADNYPPGFKAWDTCIHL
jgi:hypothetical protein